MKNLLLKILTLLFYRSNRSLTVMLGPKLGIAKGNFYSEKYPTCLELWLGDPVVIVEENGDWLKGYHINQPNNIGIFPACYVHRKLDRKSKIVEEAIVAVDEWVKLYLKVFQQKQNEEVTRRHLQLR
jgi:hypothetical protein